ncbi:succinate dehydrogenase, hydrophobic membrane anchor protein [Phaeovibrio sulfidiphilus]|uniref:Succinate dehydrogenase hydrophobic membrane anchor subunit n=1 Tax=Phaeovibrio sulfidiphilus TaxID=1220600 RepID=A0A8J7CWF8_9PROT|nr:succinate dehydrogenase, hydrophobic membrane anchor protein [Phaeovibrio sulfidiphilus]MBE1237426.1 succinate dehydrogenase, hydrophobic membrane anchor protein [Phaeovibrio sulfidiphilus]
MQSFRSPLGRARGLGPSREAATGHWFSERLPALGLIPLMLWFIFCAVIPNIGASHAEFADFLTNPLNATLMILVVLLGFYHGLQGLLVIVGDYIGTVVVRNFIVFFLKLYAIFGAALASIAVLKLSIGG